jgi:hypothetical protein
MMATSASFTPRGRQGQDWFAQGIELANQLHTENAAGCTEAVVSVDGSSGAAFADVAEMEGQEGRATWAIAQKKGEILIELMST